MQTEITKLKKQLKKLREEEKIHWSCEKCYKDGVGWGGCIHEEPNQEENYYGKGELEKGGYEFKKQERENKELNDKLNEPNQDMITRFDEKFPKLKKGIIAEFIMLARKTAVAYDAGRIGYGEGVTIETDFIEKALGEYAVNFLLEERKKWEEESDTAVKRSMRDNVIVKRTKQIFLDKIEGMKVNKDNLDGDGSKEDIIKFTVAYNQAIEDIKKLLK